MLARVGGLPFSILEEFRIDEEKDFHEQFFQFQNQLQELSHSEVLLKGAIQTSDSFFENILRYQNKQTTNFRKKENQTQRSLFQYLTRTVGKTSPFSTLTTLSTFNLENNVFKNIQNDDSISNVKYNHQLILELKNWIFKSTDFLLHLEVQLNPTLRKIGNEFVFYTERNGEKIQKFEVDQVIEVIFSYLKNPSNLNELVNYLLEQIDANREGIINYLYQIEFLGLIEYSFPNLIENENPMASFCTFVKTFPKFEQQDFVYGFLSFLENKKIEFKYANAVDRLFIKREIIIALKEIGLEDVPIKYLFYEDVAKTNNFELNANLVLPFLEIADVLVEIFTPLVYDQMRSQVISFFEKNKIKENKISVLDFFEIFSQQEYSESEIYKSRIDEIRNFWKAELNTLIELDKNGNVNLSSKELLKIHQKVLENFSFVKKEKSNFHSGHFQFFKRKESLIAVVNGIAPGHGKLFGRFSYFFPKKFMVDIKDWNIPNEDEIWLQNKDSTVFNANTQDCFFHKIIGNEKEDVNLKNLEIEWKEGELTLIDSKLNKRIRVFDIGIVAPNERSIMYQFLKIFGAPHVSFSVFTEMVNQLLDEDKAIQKVPRITIDDQLVIQRKGQLISSENLPSLINYQDLYQWKNQNFHTNILFVKTLNENFSKPHLIDFKSPLSILNFKKILNSKPQAILFSEMLPSENDLIKIGEKKYCTEFVLQWK